MAGIGFRLHKLLKSSDLYTKVGGLLSSVILSTGPWLSSVIGIGLISLFVLDKQDIYDRQLFRVIINYAYAMALILFSMIEMVTTRTVSDMIYLRQERVIPSVFIRISLYSISVSLIASFFFFFKAGLELRVAMASALLIASITLVWCAMIFMSACKDYTSIAISFFLGMPVSIFCAWGGAQVFQLGLFGTILGYLAGQLVTVFGMVYRIFREFGAGDDGSTSDTLNYVLKNRIYMAVGFFYGAATWIDKIVFWISKNTGEKVMTFFYKSAAYDSSVFVAYLFTIPAMTYFMVQVETRFYIKYRQYFSMIDSKAPLSLIHQGLNDLIETLRENIKGIVILQMIVVFFAIFFSTNILHALTLPATYNVIFRYGVIGSTLHVFVLFINILILYFDMPRMAARNYIVFFALNGGLSYLTTTMDFRFHGLGYVIAGFASLLLSIWSLNAIMRDLHYLVFRKQPYTTPAEST